MASSSNGARLCVISNASSNQQHTEIIVLVINLIDFPNIELAPLGFLEFGIDAPILSPPLDVLAP